MCEKFLPIEGRLWQNLGVKSALIIRHVLAICVIAGLISGLLAAPVAAARMMQSVSMDSMANDMPCCPHMPSSTDDHKCPFMTICMSQSFLSLPAGLGVGGLFTSVSRVHFQPSDTFGDGLAYSPPPRPPRPLIRSA
jgi:hypothetical protein